jgi:hypothetical protein
MFKILDPSPGGISLLETLDLSDNAVGGPFPAGLANLTSLTHLALANNKFTGILSPALGALTSLDNLYVFGNLLTGTIPAALFALTSLVSLYLNENKLSGTISDLSALTALSALDLSDNLLTGAVPQLSALTSLTDLNLENNAITGAFPDLSRNTVLSEVWLSGNRLLGGPLTSCPGDSRGLILSAGDGDLEFDVTGLYTELQITTDTDYADRGGRPAFSGPGLFLYYFASYQDWIIGPVLGSSTVSMFIDSDADHPLSITGQWEKVSGGGSQLAPSSFAVSVTVITSPSFATDG